MRPYGHDRELLTAHQVWYRQKTSGNFNFVLPLGLTMTTYIRCSLQIAICSNAEEEE